MFIIFLKLAIRNILSSKIFSSINIIGLSIGITAFTLIFLFVNNEFSYDNFHKNKDNIYRLATEFLDENGIAQGAISTMPPSYGPNLKNEIPEIICMARIFGNVAGLERYVINNGERNQNIEHVYFADSSFFDIFSFPVLLGNPETALVKPNSVILSESTALQLFGDINCLGKSLYIDAKFPLEVTAVLADPPRNSHFTFNMLISFSTLKPFFGKEAYDWVFGSDRYANCYTYVLLADKTDPLSLETAFNQFLDKYVPEADDLQIGLIRTGSQQNHVLAQKLTSIHFNSDNENEFLPPGNMDVIKILVLIAVLILLLACINFINLTTARSTLRAKEVFIRKVVGAQKHSLIVQYFIEAIIVTAISITLTFAFIELTIPIFNKYFDTALSLSQLNPLFLFIYLTLLFVFISSVIGFYPALYLANFNPISVLRKNIYRGQRGKLSRSILVALQFTVTSALLIIFFSINRQINFMGDAPLGYDKNNLIVIPHTDQTRHSFNEFREKLLADPSILNVTTSYQVPSQKLSLSLDGQGEFDGEIKPLGTRYAIQGIDEYFFDTYRMKIIAGRNFLQSAKSQNSELIITELGVTNGGWKSPQEAVNKRIILDGKDYMIVGVVQDFYFESLEYWKFPIAFEHNPYATSFITIRLNPEKQKEALAYFEATWRDLHPDSVVEFSFLDDKLRELYGQENQLQKLIGIFGMISLLLSLSGLFGLVIFSLERRTKEVGIRRLLGAHTPSILWMITFDFLKPVLPALLIAWIVSYYYMKYWLNGYALHIPFTADLFLSPSIFLVIFSVTVIVIQSIKTAKTNPVESLRYE